MIIRIQQMLNGAPTSALSLWASYLLTFFYQEL